ncbi:flavin reductase family protein [Planctomicrobium sp. SH527]|uniref:flavin reductase family protein n=1 Tax=Planctomicrobium sp. SH527 TaxID=3448123 RepID=UPI003F5BE178
MSETFGKMLGRIPSGLFILTARGPNGEETGMLASWVQQSGFEPPSLTVAVNSKRYLLDWLGQGATVALSQLGDSQKQLLGHFGKGFEPGVPAFEGLAVDRSPSGLPVLSDSLGWIEGSIAGSLDAGDHVVLLVQVATAESGTRHEAEKPWVHLRKNGLRY